MLLLTAVLSVVLAPASADQPSEGDAMVEDFTMQPETRWRFFTDQVMGGASSGSVAFAQENGQTFARMTGRVSTANNGGFIQMRLDLTTLPPDSATGVRIVVRGNSQNYFIHLRTSGNLLPWQYYQAEFSVTETWSEVRLPLAAFTASSAFLSSVPRLSSLTSVAVVAYGRDHDALIDVQKIKFY
jgi:hypothetical protein